MNRHQLLGILLLSTLILIASGCGGGGGGGGSSTATVTGTITFGSDYKVEANVAIQLVSSSTGAVYDAVTDAEGKYSITGVTPGKYIIRYYHQDLPPYDNLLCESESPEDVKLNQANNLSLNTEATPGIPE